MIEEVWHKQEEFNKYAKKKELEINMKNKERPWTILISFLTEETMLLSLYMTTVLMIPEAKRKVTEEPEPEAEP